jgi:hypothetical protein
VFDSYAPNMVVMPTENQLSVLKQIAAIIPDVFFHYLWYITSRLLPDDEASAYTYGHLFTLLYEEDEGWSIDITHPIMSFKHISAMPGATLFTASGTGIMSQDIDDTRFEQLYPRSSFINATITNAAQLAEVSEGMKRKAAVFAPKGLLTVPMNQAHDIYDVITVYPPATPLNAIDYRIIGLAQHYDIEHGKYTTTMILGGV